MFRPTGFADLRGRRVGVFGYGIEGRASARRLQGLASEVVIVDDRGIDGALATDHGGLERLATCDVVLKSPGIPRRRPDVLALEQSGVYLTSALNLWLGETDRSRVIGVTGTKGKSTTTALITYLLEVVGETATSAGNIGRPPYDVDFVDNGGYVVLELSSFQATDLEWSPATVAVTSLGSDHLDWHGSTRQYHEDKLAFTRSSEPHHTFASDVAALRNARTLLGGDVAYVAATHRALCEHLGLLGEHNVANVSLALEVVAHVTQRDVTEIEQLAMASATSFTALAGRLSVVATTSSEPVIHFVDDGLATSPLPTLAALASFVGEPLAIILGGFDRGVDYGELATTLASRPAFTLIATMGPAGERLHKLLIPTHPDVTARHASSLEDAVRWCFVGLRSHGHGGTVLLSPAAPSFDAYENWEQRSREYANLAHNFAFL